MGRKAFLRFALAVCLAIAGLAVLLGLLVGAQEQVYAASSQPASGGAVLRLAPPSGPAPAPAASPPLAPLSQGAGDVITVCSGCPITSVQAAVNAAATGDTIKVAQGVYTDANTDGVVVVITKMLTLRGGYTTTNWTVSDPEIYRTQLNGLGAARVISIAAGIAPTVEGFEICNGDADKGGGVYIAGGSPTLRSNRIYSNTADAGGGVYIAAGSPVVQNNLIYLNQSSIIGFSGGGGVYVADGTSLLQHNTFYANAAVSYGGGVYIAAGSPVISATIIASNAAFPGTIYGGGIYAFGGSAPILDYNDVWDNTGGNYWGTTAGGNSISANPLFENPAAENFRLLAGSPCRDLVPVAHSVGLDYEGRARPFGEQSDVGAHEFYSTDICSVRLGSGRVYTSVQAAVDAAGEGDLIKVAGYCAGVEGRSGVTQTVYISKGLTLRGGYTVINWSDPDGDAYVTTLDAEGQGRVVYVNSAAAVVVEGFRIYNGAITGTGSHGGGVYLGGGGDHVVRYNEIYSNTANNDGGGVYLGSSARVYENDIYSNVADSSGGGVYVDSGARVYGNDIYSNTAVGVGGNYGGGGICVEHDDALVYDNVVYANKATGTGEYDGGGGIQVRAGAMVQDNVVYDNQSARVGGGIQVYLVAAAVRGNTVYENTAADQGGGIHIKHLFNGAVVEYNTIYSNTASGVSNKVGGGVYVEGSTSGDGPTIQYNTISSNTVSAKDGGGIYAQNSSLIRGNIIYNHSANRGGGIAVTTVSGPGPIIERNEIFRNDATTEGGGIWTGDNDQATIEGNLVYSNTGGDGINIGFTALVQNNTVYGNAEDGIEWRGAGAPTLRNNTAYGNGEDGIDLGNDTATLRNNIAVSNTSYGITAPLPMPCDYCNVWGNPLGINGGYGGFVFGTNSISGNPLFVTPGVDFHLLPGSPCIDTADPSDYPAKDLDGVDRPIGSRADVGAYEFRPGTCFARIGGSGQVYTDVQTAVYTASPGVEVQVAGLCQGVLAVGGGTVSQTVYISQALTLRGGYTFTNWVSPTTQTVLDPQGQGRGVYITGTGAVMVDGFIIRGGSAVTGGGLYVAMALSPMIQNIVFYNNSADYGGGFGSAGGSPRLYNDTFISNTATYSGGAVYLGADSPVVSNTIVVSNTAASGGGGGIFATVGFSPSLAYNNVWQNTGGNYAGSASADPTDFSDNPLFADFAFHLQPDSPCIHTGDPGTTLDRDFEGDDRPLGRGYDVGADESALYPDVSFTPYSEKSGFPGDSVVHVHFLTNTGTITDTFDLTSTLTTSETDWFASHGLVFLLPPGAGVNVPVTISVPSEAVSGTWASVVITAESRLNSDIYSVVSNTTIVSRKEGVELAPAYDEYVNPGTVITYVHTITNTGNVSDTFVIEWSSSYGWAGVTPQNLSLGSYVTATVWVSIEIPGTAPGGLIETTVLTATSPGSGAQAVLTDTTEVNYVTGDRHVDDDAVDGDVVNNCLIAGEPCRTIGHAVDQAIGGDTVKVAEGTYNEHDININKNITLRGGYTTGDWAASDPENRPTTVDAQGAGRVFYVFGTPTIEGFIIQGGATAGSGGGIYIFSPGSPLIRQNVISGNTAGVYGGGIYNELGAPVLEQNVLKFNSAYQGGGFASTADDPGFWSNMVYDNVASADGGGVYVSGGSPRIWHDTLYNNTADRGGGIYLAGSGSPVVSNTIVAKNTAVITGGGIYSQATGAALDYNDVWDNTPTDFFGASLGPNSISQDPSFVYPNLVGGERNLRIRIYSPPSPCIDIGDATTVAEDFEGDPRTMGDKPDIGADEAKKVGVQLESDDTDSGKPGDTITYRPTLTNKGNYTDTFKITATSERGWELNLPDDVELGPDSSKQVDVSIKIKANAIAYTVDRMIVTATSYLDGNFYATVVNTTTVERDCDMGWSTPTFRRHRVASDEFAETYVSFSHVLNNDGNFTDTYDLDWSGSGTYGWWPVDGPSSVVVGPYSSKTVYFTVTVEQAPTSTLMVDTISITATAGCVSQYDIMVHRIIVNQKPGLVMEKDESGSGGSGATLTYKHILTNTGNYYDNTIWLTWHNSEPEWTVEVNDEDTPPKGIGLWPNSPSTVTVKVTIPDDATCDDSNTTIITATSWAGAYMGQVVSVTVRDVTNVAEATGIEFTQDETGNVSSDPSQPVAITYTHHLTNDGNCADTFHFISQTIPGFTVTVVPASVPLQAWESTTIDVIITVPPTDTSNLLVYTAIITAEGIGEWPKEAVVDTTIVNQAAGVTLTPDNTDVITQPSPGHGFFPVQYTHTLTNDGNYTDTFYLTSWNEDAWTMRINGQAPPVAVVVGSGAITTVQVEVQVPWYVYTITNRTVVTATSEFSPSVAASAVNTTTVRRPHVTLWPNIAQSVAPGDVITHVHRLTNTGGITDTYVITYFSSRGWAVVTPTVVYTLPPGSGVPVTATISVPTETMILSGTADTLVITATSQITEVVYDTAVDTTTVPYVPAAVITPDPGSGEARPGNAIVYTHTVTNTGNYTETFRLKARSEYANIGIVPGETPLLGPEEAYTQVVVTVLLPTHAATGETEESQVLVELYDAEKSQWIALAVAHDRTYVIPITGTRYIALQGTNENNNCRIPDWNPCATIQQAVDQALTGDEVRVAQGVYTDVHVHVTSGYTQVVYLEKSLTLRGGYTTSNWIASDPVARLTALDAGGQGRVIYVGAGIAPTIEGFHLRGGYASGTDNGAGLYIATWAKPTVQLNWIYSNTAQGGYGGGVYYDGGVGTPVLQRNTVYTNTAQRGAGFYIAAGSPRVWNNVVYRNYAADRGGGLYNGTGNPLIWNNTFYSNTADRGGGLYLAGGSPVVSNTIIAENTAVITGGGIYSQTAGALLDYNDVFGNSPTDFFGASLGPNSIPDDPRFMDAAGYDLYLRGNSPAINAGDPSSTLPNDDRDGNQRALLSPHDIGAYENGLTSAKAFIEQAPSGALITYTIMVTSVGGAPRTNIPVTDTLHPYLDYVALDYTTGSGEYITSGHIISWTGPVSATPTLITITARITGWVAAYFPITNVAWVNYTPTAMVTTMVEPGPGPRYVATTGVATDTLNSCLQPERPCLTIQYAVDQALPGDEVRVAMDTYTSLAAGQVVSVSKAIALVGGYEAALWEYNPDVYTTTLEAPGGTGVTVIGPVTGTVTVAGFHVVSGTKGVAVYTATVIISRCRIYDNSDGIYVTDGDLTLQRSWVYDNADDGVEMVGSGAYTLTNNVIAHNTGAGLRAAGTGTVLNNTFARNDAAGAVVSDTVYFTNTIFYSHTVGISVASGSAYLSNTIWYSNTTNQAAGALISSTNVYSDPVFVNPDGMDYHIQVDSAAIEAGVNVTWLTEEDIDGHPRPLLEKFDIGADEFALVIAKQGPASADPGEIITYIFALEGQEEGLVLTDTLPSYLTLTGTVECSGAGSCGWSYVASQWTITWTGDISVTQPAYITYTAQITTWLGDDVEIFNDAEVLMYGAVYRTGPSLTTINGVPGPRHVDAATGVDTDNSCRMEWKPCATVQRAVGQARSGDTVKVAEDTYTGAGSNVVFIDKSLTLEGGYTTAWTISDPVNNPTYLDGEVSRRVIYITGTVPVTVTGFHLINGSASDDGGGLYAYAATVTLANNWIYSNTAQGGYGGGVYVWGVGSTELTLTNNVIAANQADSGGDGLYVGGNASAQGYLCHNTIADNAEEGLRVGAFTLYMTNTILSGHTVGITTSSGSANVTADYTLWDGNGTDTDDSAGGSITTDNDLTGDPSFINSAAMDYHIKGDSAAAGAGVWAGVDTDIDGESRSSPPDVGADQYPLRISRWASPDELGPSQTVTHTLAITNVADYVVYGVTLTDTLPAGVNYDSSINTVTYTLGSGGYTEGAIGWTVDVPAQSSVYITYSVNITPYLTDGIVITFTASVSDLVSVFSGDALTVTVRTLAGTVHKEGQGAVLPAGEATIGELVTYTVLITVPAGHVAYEPVVVDELPRLVESGGTLSASPALTYVVGSGSVTGSSIVGEIPSADGGTITWTLKTVTATTTVGGAEIVTLTFNARVLDLTDNTGGDLLTNTVTISYTELYSAGLARVIGDAQVLTLAEPNPVLTHTAAMTQELGTGELVVITVTVHNTGTTTLYDVMVTDTLQGGWVVSDTGAEVFTRNIISISAGGSIPVTFTARVSDTIEPAGILTATAEVLGTSLPGIETYERVYTITQAVITATIGYPNLLISKDGPAVRSPGQEIVYTIRYTNTGAVPAEGVQITDTLPLSLTGLISATSAGATVEHVGQTITWTLTSPVGRGASGDVWITATVTITAQEGAVLVNTAGLVVITTTEMITTDNSALASTTVQLPSLSITKTVEPAAAVLPDDLLTYTLTISNAGLGDATGLVISDTVPLSTTYQPLSCSGGNGCGESGGVVTWTMALLPAGEERSVTFTVQVNSDVEFGTTILNETYDVASTQGMTATADAPVGTMVDVVRDLSLEPPTQVASILPGAQWVYIHTLKNLGNLAATFDLAVSPEPLGWTYTLQPSSVALAPNQSVIITLTVQAPASTGQAVAVITATWQGVPIVYATAVDTTTVGCAAPSAVSIDYSPTAPLIGQTVTFTATVTGGTPPFNYTWDFGDSSGDTGRVVTHAYDDDTSYNVQLTVTNCGGVFQDQDQRIVIVNPYNIYLPLVLRNYQ